ncbi:MAG: DUF5995 family protein [Actinomycetota bacterium]
MRTSIDEVIAELDDVIARAIDQRDAAGYFAVLYRKVTATIRDGLATGFFDDAERMERLDVLFAERYLEAVQAHRDGGRPTDAWSLAFEAGDRWRPLVLQHLLIGINAHINLDLGIAAAKCSPGPELAELRADYDRVNGVLAAMTASVQTDLARISPWIGVLDRIGGRTPDELIRFSIVAARAGAWAFATELAAEPGSRWPAMIHERDLRVAQVGERVLHPGPLMSSGLLLIRLRERGDVASNLELLRTASQPSFETIEARVEELSLQP